MHASVGDFSLTYTEGNNTAPTPTVSNTDLLQTSVSGRTSVGSFYSNIDQLTDGRFDLIIGASLGFSITYNFDTSTNALGYSISGVDIFTVWQDNGRIDPNVTVLYSVVGSPEVFQSLATLQHTHTIDGTDPWIKSSIDGGGSNILTGVAAIKFDFGAQQNDMVSYSEFDVYGTPTTALTGGLAPININESDITLSQNPFSESTLSIKLPEDATQLSIFDVTGKMVYQENAMKNEYLVDQSVFKSKGVYVVNVRTATNFITKKLIVTK